MLIDPSAAPDTARGTSDGKSATADGDGDGEGAATGGDDECNTTKVDGACTTTSGNGGGEWAGMKVIKLAFEPHWKGHRDGFYFQRQQNRCVRCASTTRLVKFQIVPNGFKKFFPAKIKSNSANNTQGNRGDQDAPSKPSLILL